ncbi:MAG: hypothetical protein GWP07_02175 [Xanthomonadaceae bacterium]|nr:hypothetical protein [Xanthomonadaceae bacterium]
MAFAHSRCTSCAAPRCSPRITVVVILSAPNAAISQAQTSPQKVEFYHEGLKNMKFN